jgi:hypothetical protein
MTAPALAPALAPAPVPTTGTGGGSEHRANSRPPQSPLG